MKKTSSRTVVHPTTTHACNAMRKKNENLLGLAKKNSAKPFLLKHFKHPSPTLRLHPPAAEAPGASRAFAAALGEGGGEKMGSG